MRRVLTCVGLLSLGWLAGGCAQHRSLDAWLGSELDRLAQTAGGIHAENSVERRQAFARTPREVFVVAISADEDTPDWQREELNTGLANDLEAHGKRRVAAAAALQELIELAVEQSSDFFDAEAGVPFGSFTPAQVFLHATIRQSWGPVMPTPDDVRPRGQFRYWMTDYTVAAYDIETAEVLLETAFQTLTLRGPGD